MTSTHITFSHPGHGQGNARKAVLLWIGSPPMNGSFTDVLDTSKWAIQWVQTVAEAFDVTRKWSIAGHLPDVILLDTACPSSAVRAFCRYVQSISGWSSVVCVGYCSNGERAPLLNLVETGWMHCLSPSLKSDIWDEHLRALLRYHRSSKPPLSVRELLPSTAFSPRYTLIQPLGQGGMAHVFLVEDVYTSELRALKIFVPTGQESFGVEQFRFFQEVRALLSVQDNTIHWVDDIGRIGHLLYYTMRYLPGGSLRQRIQNGALSSLEAIRIALGVCSHVEWMHQQGWLHRDIKPSNILFTEHDEPVLIDFGIVSSQIEPAGITGEHALLGTAAYIAPERLTLEDSIDVRSDVYALGLLLYEMLAGSLPYTSGDLAAMHRTMMTGLPALSVQHPTVPSVLGELCRKATQYAPALRFQSVAELRHALFDAKLQLERCERILIVDYDPMVTKIILPQLEALGAQCFVVQSTSQALDWVCVQHPDLVFLNMHMPDLDGFALIQHIQKFPTLAHVPFVLVADEWSEGALRRAALMGIDACVKKPFKLQSMARRMYQVAARYRKSLRPAVRLSVGMVVEERFTVRSFVQRTDIYSMFEVFDQQEHALYTLTTLHCTAIGQPKAMGRVDCEIRTLKKLHHPGILELIHDGLFEGCPYWVMPSASETLADFLREQGPMHLRQALECIVALAEIVEYIHEESIVHRRISPQTVVRMPQGQWGLTYLGHALHLSEKTKAQKLYSTQEQHPKWDDMYALGALLIELITLHSLSEYQRDSRSLHPQQVAAAFASLYEPSELFHSILTICVQSTCYPYTQPYPSIHSFKKDCLHALKRV